MSNPAARPDSVRLAFPAEGSGIAAVQRRSWLQTLPEAASAVLADVDVEQMTAAWERAITRPPEARFRVLVALTGEGRTVGFATTRPSADPDAEPGVDGTVEEFAVDPPAQRRGHGSRLLHACVDTLRADGFRRATWWVSTTDDVLRQFLLAAGWAPDGGHREIGTDDAAVRVRQIRLHTDISAG